MTVVKTNNLNGLKIGDLRAFDAVARTLSFAEAGRMLGRSHPSVFSAVGRLEERLGLALLDRAAYRSKLTEAGVAFHQHVRSQLQSLEELVDVAGILRQGFEPRLTVVLGDLARRKTVLGMLAEFFSGRPATQLNLDFEAVAGPSERVRNGSADLAIHRVDPEDLELEILPLERVRLIPVAVPGFFDCAPRELSIEALRLRAQCIIRDTAKEGDHDYFLVDGAPQCTVPDHGMKKELIYRGLAWGHLPEFMIAGDLQDRTLIDLRGKLLPGREETIGLMRRRDGPRGPVAGELWGTFEALACGNPAHS